MATSKEFNHWNKIMTAKMMGQETIEDKIDRLMQPQNLIIEGRVDDKWEALKEGS